MRTVSRETCAQFHGWFVSSRPFIHGLCACSRDLPFAELRRCLRNAEMWIHLSKEATAHRAGRPFGTFREDLRRNIAADVSERPVLSSSPLITLIGAGSFHVQQHRKQQPRMEASRRLPWLLPQYLVIAASAPLLENA